MWFYIKKILLLVRLSLLLNKYFNLFNFFFIIVIKPFDFNLLNTLVEDEALNTTKDNYKWWLQKIIVVTMFVVGIYVLYKLASNGTDVSDVGSLESEDLNSEEILNSNIKAESELTPNVMPGPGPIISKHW